MMRAAGSKRGMLAARPRAIAGAGSAARPRAIAGAGSAARPRAIAGAGSARLGAGVHHRLHSRWRWGLGAGARTGLVLLAAAGLVVGCGAQDTTPVSTAADGASGAGGAGGAGQLAIDWDAEPTEVTSGPDIGLAFNSTRIGGRDDQQELHLVWTDGTDVLQGVVQQGQHSFSISSLPPGAPSGVVSKPTMAFVDGASPLVAWTVRAAGKHTLYISRSQDLGQSWAPPIAVVAGKIDSSFSLHAYRRGDGSPGAVLAWYDAATAQVRSSAWQGTAWSPADWTTPVNLASGGGSSHDVSVGGSGETVMAAWEDDRSGTWTIFVSRSDDGGLSWSGDVALPVAAGGAPEGQDPSVGIRPDGAIFVGHQRNQQIFLTRSTDSGQSFEPYTSLGPGLFAHTAVDGADAVAVSWEHFKGDMLDDTLKTVGLAVSLDDLASIDTPHALPGSASVTSATFSAVLLNDSFIDVVWVDVSQVSSTGNMQLEWRSGRLP